MQENILNILFSSDSSFKSNNDKANRSQQSHI
jgi:hypothetical protein